MSNFKRNVGFYLEFIKTKIVLLLLIFNFASCNYLFQLKSDDDFSKLLIKKINSNSGKSKFIKIADVK
jgi:hypothetical protein